MITVNPSQPHTSITTMTKSASFVLERNCCGPIPNQWRTSLMRPNVGSVSHKNMMAVEIVEMAKVTKTAVR